MKILIIGCGYVGQAIAREWVTAGHDLTLTTTTPAKVAQLAEIAPQVQAKILSGSDLDALREICEGQDLILLSVGSKGRTEAGYRLAYLQTAQNLKEALQGNGTVKQIIYTSSYSVVGHHGGAWVDETSPDKPGTPFAEILLETEQVLSSIETGDRRVCILRLGGIYGENREILKIFRGAMGQVRPGTGEEYSNWIHLADIVGGIKFAGDRRLSGVFNLVCDEPIKRNVLLDRLAEKYNLDPVIWDATLPPARPFNVRVSNQKLKDLGFSFQYPTIQL